ncbi:RNA polymerase sigma factor [Microlunatus antarcticus]|uniref:RNA polymerase sigma-70 factor (ECF subfamily) n=1 Tax=Microlunatus antarcticus TaxID=53388 RepID=A0A7W5JY43_9ACTN|nr:RNA polymerase sigma factor [Microlunatus antarcticus]MBB3328453.1 RNA polymerase sigma-70 factor (ECF subfamily) [Microlunatus antarcticus]
MGQPGPLPAAAHTAAEEEHDLALWSQVRSADADALTALFDRHARAVYNFAFRRTASWSNAEDITQATFLTLWRRAAAGDLPELEHLTALPWLLGVADHEHRGIYRSLMRRRRLQVRLEGVHDHTSEDPAEAVTDRLDDERRMAAVRRAVSVLPTHQRIVVELVVWSHLTTKEAAAALGVAEGTVKSRLSRARTRLGLQLDQPEEER